MIAMQAQLKNKEELLPSIQNHHEKNARNLANAATAELRARLEILKAENQHLAKNKS